MFRSTSEPVLYLSNSDGMSRDVRRGLLDDLATRNELKFAEVGDPEIVLHLRGINHESLTYQFQGRYFRLSDVHGKVVSEVLWWHLECDPIQWV